MPEGLPFRYIRIYNGNTVERRPPRQGTDMSNLRAIFASKPANLKEATFGGAPIPIEIEGRREMTAAEYDGFTASLLEDRDWLAGKGGLRNGKAVVIEITAPNRKTLYIDASGFDYARYVGIAW